VNCNLDKSRFLALKGRDGRRDIASRPGVRNAGEKTKNIEFNLYENFQSESISNCETMASEPVV
jgi:hypothetical protein